jgi:hypothetical protein
MLTLLQDLRFSLRQLRKSPGFTITAVLTLAMAIGANSLVFSVLNGLILRPLDVPQSESLYSIEHTGNVLGLSYPDYLDLRDRNRSFDDLAGYSITQAALNTGDGPNPVWEWRRAGTTLTLYASSPISAVSSTPPTSTVRTAPPMLCSATHIGTATFTMNVAWSAESFS